MYVFPQGFFLFLVSEGIDPLINIEELSLLALFIGNTSV